VKTHGVLNAKSKNQQQNSPFKAELSKMLVEKRCGGAKEVAYLGKPVEIRLDLNGY
jgi:hypothetical protein